jgi:hypothetical protein
MQGCFSHALGLNNHDIVCGFWVDF